MKPKLSTVTLCAVDGVSRVLATRALEICGRYFEFADTILFSPEPVDHANGPIRHVTVDKLRSFAAYTPFFMRELHAHIQTAFALVTQWDGYIINPGAWTDEFLNYDYIGSPWPWMPDNRVGNGGFSLRSKRLLQAISDPQFVVHGTWNGESVGEDVLMCRIYRPLLEQKYGIRFAPEAVAERFAYERGVPKVPTLGFHGSYNFWREVSDTDLAKIVLLMPPNILQHLFTAELAACYFQMQRWTALRSLFKAWRSQFSAEQVSQMIGKSINPQIAPSLIAFCEHLIRQP